MSYTEQLDEFFTSISEQRNSRFASLDHDNLKYQKPVPFVRRIPLLFPDRSQTEETEARRKRTVLFLRALCPSIDPRRRSPAIHELIAMRFPFRWTRVIVSRLRQWAYYPRVIIRGGRGARTRAKGKINSSNAEGGERYRTNVCMRVCVCVCAGFAVYVDTSNPPTSDSWLLGFALCACTASVNATLAAHFSPVANAPANSHLKYPFNDADADADAVLGSCLNTV